MPVKSNINDFTAKAKEIHGDKYSYDKFIYVNGSVKGVITCPIHGDFEQRPSGHLAGSGCPECGGRKRKDTKSFIEEARKTHGNFYDYSKTKYKKIKINVTITCPVHGDFEQRPDLHIRGHGCPKCADEKRTNSLFDDNDSFISKSRKVHGDRYDYSKVDYKSCYKNVIVTCRDHGDFSINPRSHIQGVGCKKCSRNTYNNDHDAFLYIARSKCGRFEKIGVTNDPAARLVMLRAQTPFDLYIKYTFCCKNARDVETHAKRAFKNAGLTGFNACTEWFDSSEVVLHEFCMAFMEFE